MMKWLKLGVLIGLVLAASGCSSDSKAEIKPPLVKTQSAVPARNTVETFSAQIKGRREAALSFQTGGEIISRLVDVGSRVQAGDILMTISPRDIRQKVVQSQAQIASSQAKMELAQTNLSRYEELFAAAAVPEAVLDQYRMNCRAAEAAYQSALAEGREAQNALAYTELVAPSAGVITQITAEAGQVVAEGHTVMTLMQTDEMEAEVFLPENRLDIAPVGKEVRIRFWTNSADVPGIVREVSPMATEARTYRVRVTLWDIPAGVEAGMTAQVDFPDSQQETSGCLLPLSSIYQTGEEPQVFLVQDGKLSAKPVKILAYRGNTVEVRGLNPKEHVVVSGVYKLQAGQTVREEHEEETP